MGDLESRPEGHAPCGEVVLPADTPDWITPQLVLRTIQVWQPYYKTPLSADDAVTMIQNVGRLFGIFNRS